MFDGRPTDPVTPPGPAIVPVPERTTTPSQRALRVMIAGGGTGGHLFPGVALAEQVRAAGGEVRFVGTERGIEARVLPESGWDLDLIEVSGIKGRGLKGLVGGVARLPRAWLQSRRLIRGFRPDVVVGVGGYASGPIVATASSMRIPTAILEQNSIPGITNRILGRLVKKVFTTFPDERGFFPRRKIVRAGNPIRAELLERLAGAGGREETAGQPPRLFVFGGSQGARALNEAMLAAAPKLMQDLPGLEIWHQTGRKEAEKVEQGYAEHGLQAPQVRVSAFIKDMAEPYGWCDLVVCRAGATSLAELAAVGAPALLIPFPHATDNHQEHNARALVDVGAARLLLESELDAKRLADDVTSLLADPEGLVAMRNAMHAAAKPDAAREIYDSLVSLARR